MGLHLDIGVEFYAGLGQWRLGEGAVTLTVASSGFRRLLTSKGPMIISF